MVVMNKLFFKTVFFILVILPAFSPLSAGAENRCDQYLIVVDPAHGGRDNGVKLTGKLHEKDVTLAVAVLIKDILSSSKKFNIKLTRSSDSDIAESERGKLAKKSGADLFISLHVNAGFGKTSSGFEAYFPGFKSPSNRKDTSQEISRDMVKTRELNDSVRFAKIILENMGEIFPRKDRGLRVAPISVLNGVDATAVALEMGFATNIKDRKLLMDKSIQKSIAETVAKSIKEFAVVNCGEHRDDKTVE